MSETALSTVTRCTRQPNLLQHSTSCAGAYKYIRALSRHDCRPKPRRVRRASDLAQDIPPKQEEKNTTEMDNAELYQKSNNLQKRDALDALEEYATKIKWKNFDHQIIDIGCGDGSVTTDILKEHVPRNYKKLVGCDISKKMVQFANENYGNTRTSFIVLDIEKHLPESMRADFNHVFSFYALHWIKRQELAFMNIYDMLVEDGTCFLIFIGHHPIYDVYRILAKSNKWCSWLHDVDRYISPYHDSKEPQKEITKMMETIGFQNIEVKIKKKRFVFNSVEVLKKAVKAINPFDIPSNLFNDYMEDYLEEFRRMCMKAEVNNNHTLSVTFDYDLITVYANK